MSHFQLALPSSMAWNDTAFGIAANQTRRACRKSGKKAKCPKTIAFWMIDIVFLGCIHHLVPSSSRAVYQPYPLLDFMVS